jgi:hypothetical protein
MLLLFVNCYCRANNCIRVAFRSFDFSFVRELNLDLFSLNHLIRIVPILEKSELHATIDGWSCWF